MRNSGSVRRADDIVEREVYDDSHRTWHSSIPLIAGMAVVSATKAPAPSRQARIPAPCPVTLVVRTTKAINLSPLSGPHPDRLPGHGSAFFSPRRSPRREQAGERSHPGAVRKTRACVPLRAGILTYVLWAISPEGRADNLGELVLDGQKSKVDVTEQLQAFALIVTAEPYFASIPA